MRGAVGKIEEYSCEVLWVYGGAVELVISYSCGGAAGVTIVRLQ